MSAFNFHVPEPAGFPGSSASRRNNQFMELETISGPIVPVVTNTSRLFGSNFMVVRAPVTELPWSHRAAERAAKKARKIMETLKLVEERIGEKQKKKEKEAKKAAKEKKTKKSKGRKLEDAFSRLEISESLAGQLSQSELDCLRMPPPVRRAIRRALKKSTLKDFKQMVKEVRKEFKMLVKGFSTADKAFKRKNLVEHYQICLQRVDWIRMKMGKKAKASQCFFRYKNIHITFF
ncbi:unnamed protein product [Bursaphelenchus okinawaensis]|uniref:Uncharacterized protein n=1 Tax=Bursaphelenchus okinawaensis TaxID=465554 RepID=A0A811JRX3_9BILA|nr:unnamed protein product [Bursaphelenchus okinawaensis]CAG9080312.1 unnamed protein product [Bursaphelenchus okinawaensis]